MLEMKDAEGMNFRSVLLRNLASTIHLEWNPIGLPIIYKSKYIQCTMWCVWYVNVKNVRVETYPFIYAKKDL